jgi:regulator of sirC expression with transglutaminase-like and TPR domain
MTQRTPDRFTPVRVIIDEVPLDVADRTIAEMDDESFGGINPLGKWAVALFDSEQVGWLSPPTFDVGLGEPGCQARQVTQSERYEPEIVQGFILHHCTSSPHGSLMSPTGTVARMDRLPRWRDLLARADEEIPLDEAALIIAAQGDPTLDETAQLSRLDNMAAQVGRADAEHVFRFVFETLGLKGDDQTYDDPQNSYLHRVLDRRLGIPISLSVLLIEIGRRCGVALEGIGMPGHFLVRNPARPDVLIDAFSGGRRLTHADCARLLHGVAGEELTDTMLASVGPRAILARMLANLDLSFRRRRDQNGLRWVTRLRAAIPGLPLADRMALAEGLAGLGCYDDALTLLEELADSPGTSTEAARAIRARARGMLAPFN